MNLEAAQRRARWTAERSWTAERVEAAIRIAWAARPRTMEHTTIMSWPTMALPTESELRLAIHMMGLNAQAPSTYPITFLVRNRLGISFTTYERRKLRACRLIAECLNRHVCASALAA